MNKMEYSSKSSEGDVYSDLEDCLKNILSSIKPSKNDNENRVGTINELKNVIKSIARSSVISTVATVNPYGSYLSNLHSKRSDLDISVDGLRLTPCIRHGDKQEALRLVKRALETTGIARNIQFVPQARVPVISYESRRYNISCDVTIDNHEAQIKSKILNKINGLDSRFQDLVLLVKEWAKAQNINDPKSGTLNSFSLSLLVIYHLQTCDPPILPPLSEIYKGNMLDDITAESLRYRDVPQSVLVQCVEESCDEEITKFKSQAYRLRNQSSLTQLLLSFFNKFSSIEALSRDHMISTHSGQLKIKPFEKVLLSNFSFKRNYNYNLFIEDPFQRSENTARVVGPFGLRKISEAFEKTDNKLSSAQILSDRDSLLRILARPGLYLQLVAQDRRNGNLNTGEGSSRVYYPVDYAYIGNL